jgi:hypothetical protein
MNQYWVEGIVLPKRKKSGTEVFHQSFWANSPHEALQEALRSIPGATWLEGPGIAKKSEEQRMHDIDAPQLPGFNDLPPKKTETKGKSIKRKK